MPLASQKATHRLLSSIQPDPDHLAADLAMWATAAENAHDAIRQLLTEVLALGGDTPDSLADLVTGEGAKSAIWNALGDDDTPEALNTFTKENP